MVEHADQSNLQQYVTQLVMQEVTDILDPHVRPYIPNPKKANVIAFYGL